MCEGCRGWGMGLVKVGGFVGGRVMEVSDQGYATWLGGGWVKCAMWKAGGKMQ